MGTRSSRFMKIHPSDNAVVALQDLAAGDTVSLQAGGSITLIEDIPARHKFASCEMHDGDIVTMYGVTIGKAACPIPRGGRLGTVNLRNAVEPTVLRTEPCENWTPTNVSRWNSATFDGYHRANGSVGTANVWLVVPLVFCENRNLMLMKEAMLRPLGLDHGTPYEQYVRRLVTANAKGLDVSAVEVVGEADETACAERVFPNVDGIRFLAHGQGCGGTDSDTETLCGLLAGYITHPNVAGATVLSLGCQKAQMDALRAEIDKRDPEFEKSVCFFEQQKSRSEKQMMSDAIRSTFKGLAGADELRREPAPLSKLIVGMECGGSDGFSGISANPVIGGVSDRLAALGSGIILSEFPELSGVEQHLVDRCETPELGRRFLKLMQSYERAAEQAGSTFNQNPSYGNIANGLITGAMKSAGAARKGGSSPIRDVLDYPEVVTKSGLNLLRTPGNDVESTTAMAGAHATLMIFSTGLGTPTGNAVSPVIKISSNSATADRLPDMIDFDTGAVIRGDSSIDDLADQLLDLAIETASGRYSTKAQLLGQEDFMPWKRGLSL